jgi:hypothetical protein
MLGLPAFTRRWPARREVGALFADWLLRRCSLANGNEAKILPTTERPRAPTSPWESWEEQEKSTLSQGRRDHQMITAPVMATGNARRSTSEAAADE